MQNNFIDTALKNKRGICSVGISFTANNKRYNKRLRFYFVYLKETDTLYIISLNFNSVASVPAWSFVEKDIISRRNIPKKIIPEISEMINSYVDFYQENYFNKRLLRNFSKCFSIKLMLSYSVNYFFRIFEVDTLPNVRNSNQENRYEQTGSSFCFS